MLQYPSRQVYKKVKWKDLIPDLQRDSLSSCSWKVPTEILPAYITKSMSHIDLKSEKSHFQIYLDVC